MSVDLPPVPPAVVEFAEKHNITNVKPNIFWTKNNRYKGYTVYDANDINNDEDVYFILINDREVRLSTFEEADDIMDVYL